MIIYSPLDGEALTSVRGTEQPEALLPDGRGSAIQFPNVSGRCVTP